MSKKLLQDIVKIKRVSREKPTPQRETNSGPTRPTYFDPPKSRVNLSVSEKKQEKGRPRYTLWIVAIISIFFLLYSISLLFLRITVTVNPKVKDVVLNETLSASLGGDAEALPFNLVVISGEESKIMQTTLQKDISDKAQGVVVIYNSFSPASQIFSIDTRLEGSNGKMYKTNKQIIVPGMKGKVPGSIEVGIYSNSAGEEYNSGPLDFTVFGFKGTPKYSKFYARSKGSIVGGFKGKAFTVSDAERTSAVNDLKTTLQSKLFKKATDQIPDGFILFKDAVFLNVENDNQVPIYSKTNSISMSIKGTLYGLLLNEDKLIKKIAKNNIDGYDGSDVYLSNIQDLVFSLSNKDNVSFSDVKNIDFTLKGNTKIVWKLDETKLKTDLLGKSKKDFNQILLQYPNVDSASLVISPFWRMSLPDKTKDIKMIVNYPK